MAADILLTIVPRCKQMLKYEFFHAFLSKLARLSDAAVIESCMRINEELAETTEVTKGG